MIRPPMRDNYYVEEKDTDPYQAIRKKVNFQSVYLKSPFYPKMFSFIGHGDDSIDHIAVPEPELLLYGRIDSDGDAVMPRSNVIGPTGQGRTVMALDFVARAYTALFTDLTIDRNLIKLDGSPYKNPTPKNGWVDVSVTHSQIIQQMYSDNFTSMLNRFGPHRVINFDEFIHFFITVFFKQFMLPSGYMLTRSNFALSRYANPSISGLVIELSNDDCNNDALKYTKWLNNNGYPVFREAAARHGFMVDRNAPWRLVANPNSPRMQEYMSGRDLVSKTKPGPGDMPVTKMATDSIFIERPNGEIGPLSQKDLAFYYEKIYLKDVDFLRETMLNLYNKFVADRPTEFHRKVVDCRRKDSKEFNTPIMVTKTKNRKFLSNEKMMNDYDSGFWLNQYLLIRLMEVNASINEARIKRAYRKIYMINKYQGFDKALLYVHNYAKVANPSTTQLLSPSDGLTVRGASMEAFSALKDIVVTTPAGTVGGGTGGDY